MACEMNGLEGLDYARTHPATARVLFRWIHRDGPAHWSVLFGASITAYTLRYATIASLAAMPRPQGGGVWWYQSAVRELEGKQLPLSSNTNRRIVLRLGLV